MQTGFYFRTPDFRPWTKIGEMTVNLYELICWGVYFYLLIMFKKFDINFMS
jgi:hypothetical protein